jgi:hypothetical protein
MDPGKLHLQALTTEPVELLVGKIALATIDPETTTMMDLEGLKEAQLVVPPAKLPRAKTPAVLLVPTLAQLI